jgi:hypothetical protein
MKQRRSITPGNNSQLCSQPIAWAPGHPKVAYSVATCARAKLPALPRKNQPTALPGRREATRPPTTALSVRHRGKMTNSTSDPLMASTMAQTIKASVRAHTDQASHAVARRLIPLTS